MCDQEEYSGKKSPIGKNVKDKRIGAEGWRSPWILAQIFATTMKELLVKI